MAGNKKRKCKLLLAANKDDKSSLVQLKQDIEELPSWSGFPTELLELILSHLTIQEKIRFSAVCSRWHSIANSMIRLMNQPPWIMRFPEFGNIYELYDPLYRKTYSIELNELAGYRVCYTKGVWLLLSSRSYQLVFFNPFTRKLIELPRLKITPNKAAFSCDPTSPSCIVFALDHHRPSIVEIGTCHPEAKEWTIRYYRNSVPIASSSSIWNKLIVVGERFYCLSLTGWIGFFDPKELTWNVIMVPPPRCFEIRARVWWKGKFLAEHDGEILVINTCPSDYPAIYRLDQLNKVWEEVKTLDRITLFVSLLSSQSRTDLSGIMKNSVYFPKVQFYGKRCISYSLKNCRYYPCKEFHDFGKLASFESIWIDPPKDLSIFM